MLSLITGDGPELNVERNEDQHVLDVPQQQNENASEYGSSDDSSHGSDSEGSVHGDNHRFNFSDSDSHSGQEHSDLSDDDIELHDLDFQEERPPRQLLYNGSSLSDEESTLLIMSYAIRHSLSDVALEDLLKLIDCHLPTNCHGSLHLFLKKFPKPFDVKTHYYCLVEDCQRIVKFEGNNKHAKCECGVDCNLDHLRHKSSYFLQIPLEQQLRKLLEDESVRSKLIRGDGNQSDVCSGKVYKRLVEKGVINDNDITLQWNTDGVQLFKSSKIQLWPIQVSVNELSYRERRENIMLCGIWYGQGKPNMNTYLQPFVEELNSLHSNGFHCSMPDHTLVKVHTLLSPVDSMARAPLQNLKTFRGAHGCAFCLHPGEEHAVGRGTTRLYPGDVGRLRTQEQHLADSLRAAQTNVAKNGVKGPSVLSTLKVFSIISSFVPEYMHCVCLGTVKTMVEWWTAGKNNEKDFYLSPAKIEQIDRILLSIKPPNEVTRTPRSLTTIKLWKASEWKNFLLYYSIVCLISVNMPKKYIDHWFLLVYAMSIYLKEKITDNEFEKAKSAIRKFVLTMRETYGTNELYKYNMHLLLHIPKSVRDFSGMFGMSAFPFEHYNGVLGKMFRNSNAVPLQICKSYLRINTIKDLADEVFDDENYCSVVGKTLYDSLTYVRTTVKNCTHFGQTIRLLGVPTMASISLAEKVAVEHLVGEEVRNTNVPCYQRFIKSNVLFNVDSYQRITKRVNHVVVLHNSDLISITNIIKISTAVSNRQLCLVLGNKYNVLNENLSKDREINISSDAFSFIVEPTVECIAIHPDMLFKKCVVSPYPNNIRRRSCVFPLANLVERD